MQFALEESKESNWIVRHSRRARRLSVRVYPAGRVEVVVPLRTSADSVQHFVHKHRGWIYQRLSECVPERTAIALPHELHLIGLDLCVQVQHWPSVVKPHVVQLSPTQIQLVGQLHDPKLWSRVLYRWLMQYARIELDARLATLATEFGFTYSKLQVRRQRTRWGSCSSRGVISINICALFLPPPVLRYLLIHELCHTRHMNHSKAYWSQVADIEPHFVALDRALSRGWRAVPAWVFLN